MRSGTIFDNFLVTDDEAYAEEFGDETWGETKVTDANYFRTAQPRPILSLSA